MTRSIPLLVGLLLITEATGTPADLTPAPGTLPNRIVLDWPAVSGATGYNVKRSGSPAGPFALLGTTGPSITDFTDAAVTAGQTYYYAVTTLTSSGESATARNISAYPGIIVDNAEIANTTIIGTWQASSLSGYYGTNSVYASSTNAVSPTASFRFSPNLPFSGNYDVYIRTPAASTRATNTPVDVSYADGGLTTVAVNQTLNGNLWVLLGTFPCEGGTSASVTIRNNTGASGSFVAADAVQFVPHLGPWTPRGLAMEDYTLTTFSDECNGSALDPNVWTIALGRPNVSIANGKISLDITYTGPGTAATATLEELKAPNNWAKGAVMPVRDQKFGYYETRFRVAQQGGGLDCAFWMASRGSLLPYENFEYDSPEIFPNEDLSETSVIYGMWNHTGGAPPWRKNKILYPRSWAEQFHTYGMEWRLDNTIVHYLDGAEIGRTPGVEAVNGIACMAPIETYLSCYVGNYWQPAASLDGQSMKVDYLRCYQKPGWLGAADTNTWGDARNWGPDGIPSSGKAAMFNLNVVQPVVRLLANKQAQSLCFDGPEVSAMVIDGSYQLELGAGPSSVIQGGISVGSAVTRDQTIRTGILGLQDLSIINNSQSGAALSLEGPINGSGGTRSIRFAANAPINVTQPLGASIGTVIKWGKIDFLLPPDSAYSGATELALGPLSFNQLRPGGQNSSLGKSSAAPENLQFRPRSKYTDEAQRPRLIYTGPTASTDRGLTVGFFCDAILDASGSGPVTFNGPVAIDAGNTSIAILEFSGSNTEANTFAGVISDATALNPSGDSVSLRVRKTGSGTWHLTNANTWRGNTEVLDGTFVFSGPLTTTGNLTCSGNSTVENQGSLSVKQFNLSQTTTFRTSPSATLNASSSVILAGQLDLINTDSLAPGATFTLIQKSGTALVSGTFDGLAQNGTITREGHTFRINYNGGTGNDVTLTLLTTPIEQWRFNHFGTISNTGTSADTFDANNDGEINLLEFATGQNPLTPSYAQTTVAKQENATQFTYTRVKNAVEINFTVEYSDDLEGEWLNTNVTSLPPVTVDATTESVTTIISNPPPGRCFLRLKVTRP